MSRIVVIGGNAGGMTAAGRAARLDPGLDITVLERGRRVSYSICGAPFHLSGEVPDPQDLISYTPERFGEKYGVRVLTGTTAEAIDTSSRVVAARGPDGGRVSFRYDRLLVATGYEPLRIEVPGAGLGNVFTLSSLGDMDAIGEALGSGVRRALLVGAGLVNVELAESLRARGLEVSMVERSDRILPGLDPEMAGLVEGELQRNGVQVLKRTTVRTLFGDETGRVSHVWLHSGEERVPADLVLVDVGTRPRVRLAIEAGVLPGRSGAIAVNSCMETSVPGIYAAGNCAEAVHIVSNQPVYSALGTAANKQGRIAGENLAGIRSTFAGVLNTWVVRVFGLCVARTGLTEAEARQAGFQPVAAQVRSNARAAYLGGRDTITVRAIADRESRRLLGLQAVGLDAEKRVDVAAAVLTQRMKVEDAAQLDLSYAPPYSQTWDPFLVAMNALLKEMAR